ncbi:MAG TPA: hypothetical protein VHC22_06720, partial [Pirellulales bacterium]|nr:hypothetical protein [Pirellulales bacterium]
MRSLFRRTLQLKKARQSRKGRASKPAWPLKLGALGVAVEELEHRILLAADVSVAKSAPTTGSVGTAVTDTVTLTNSGSAAVSNVPFSDAFDNANVSNVSASDTAGDTFTYDSGTNTLNGTITSLATGDTTITIDFTPTAAGTFGDTASVNVSGNTGSPTSATGSTTVSAVNSGPDVSVAKSAPATGTVGTAVTDTVTLTNGGSSALSSVPFLDALDNVNVSNVSASDTAGDIFTYDSGTNMLGGTITSLPTGDTTITIVFTPTAAGTFGDTASVNVSGNTGSPTSATGSTTVSAVNSPDVSVAKSAPATGTVGTAVTDTVTLTNGGNAALSSVPFLDALDNVNVSNVSASDTAGDIFTYDSGTNTLGGTITSLPTGDTTITIVFTPTAAGTFGDTASVNVSGNTGSPTSATGSTTVSAVNGPDVSVAKSAPATGTVGTAVTDTVTLTNGGNAALSSVPFLDALDNVNVSNVSASDTAGDIFTYDSGTNTLGGTITSLPTGATTITIVFTPTAAGTFGDTASVNVSGNTGSPTSAMGSTTVSAVNGPDVSVAKSAPATGTVGTAVTDTVTLTNGGNAALSSVPFLDALDNVNVSNVSASDTAGDIFTYDSGTNT